MKTRRSYALVAILILSAVSPACRLFHRSAKNVPPPPKPVVTQPEPILPEPPRKIEEVYVPPPPELAPAEPDYHQRLPIPAAKLPPRPPRPRRRNVAPPPVEVSATPAEPAPSPPAPAAPAAPVPQLEQILSPEQQQWYNEVIERNIGRAQRTVEQLAGRRLSREQETYLDRIRAFISQAIEARKSDLVRARDLAERASVLAEDLQKTIQ